MLALLSLRICCLAVMAPALTEAATQVQQNFKLPPSPASSSSNSNPPSPLGTITERGSDFHSNDCIKIKSIALNSCIIDGHNRTYYKKASPINVSSICKVKADQFISPTDTMNKSELPEESNNMGIQQASVNLSVETHPRVEMEDPNVKDIMEVDTPASSPYSSSLDTTVVEHLKKPTGNPVNTPILKKVTRLSSVPLVSKRTVSIEKRADRLLHRLHKLQFKQCEKHIAEQIHAFIEHQRKCLGAGCPHRCNESNLLSSAELLQSEDMKNMSTAALVSLVRKLEAKNGPSMLNSIDGYNNEKIVCENSCVHTENLKLSTEKSFEMRRVSGTVSRNLRILESAIDSDATDSSSGGESCDELDGYSDKDKIPLKTLPIHRRAVWKWAVDRAAVASRWTWLQAQISDLEYRIRKQGDICRQLKLAKSVVSLKDGFQHTSGMEEPCQICNIDSKNNHVSSSSIANNAYLHKICEHSLHEERTCSASRVRPLQEGFKRRKLIRISDVHQIKSEKPNSVHCTCLPHMHCALCGGRYNLTQSSDTDYSTSIEERVASIDRSFHPVLSFKHDISVPIRFEKLLKGGEWQKVNSKSAPLIKKKSNLTLNNHVRSHSKKLAKTAAAQLLSSAKLRKKLVNKKHARTALPTKNGASLRKKRAKMALALKKHHLMDRNRLGSCSGNSSKAGSPVPSPAPSDAHLGKVQVIPAGANNLLADANRKRRDSAFDIDNIVIPYSMTASTRIEKLQYKEIITPKWRLVQDYEALAKQDLCKNNGIINNCTNADSVNSTKDETEDLSDEAYITRHAICEALEKKRYLGVVNSLTGRTRSRVSRADSSGANTPDPMSPHSIDPLITDHLSPVTSPQTPAIHSEDSMPPTPSSLCPTIRLQEFEGPPVVPFEPRTFPLDDEAFNELITLSSSPPPVSQPVLQPIESQPCKTEVLHDLHSSTSGSLIDEQEDPNDPEWTVISNDKPVQPQRQSASIVLKLTKR